MHVIRAVKRHVPTALDQDFTPLGRDGMLGKALPGDFEAGSGVDANEVQGSIFGSPPARVGVDLAFDQFNDGAAPVPDHERSPALGGGGKLAAHDQQAVFFALDEALDQHA